MKLQIFVLFNHDHVCTYKVHISTLKKSAEIEIPHIKAQISFYNNKTIDSFK